MASIRILSISSILTVFLTSCANHSMAPQPPIADDPISMENPAVFVGDVQEIKDGIDGSSVTLLDKAETSSIDVVLSIPNLGAESEFDFSHIKPGNLIKVRGDRFKMDGKVNMTARTAMSYIPVKIGARRATASEKRLCESLGGKIKASGKSQFDSCVQTYADAGESCANESECFGRCILDKTAAPAKLGENVVGICELKNSVFGCTSLVSGGKFDGTICID